MKLEGAMTAIVTPMKEGGPDFQALQSLVQSQIEAGIHAIVAMGTTGESATLTTSEHLAVVQKTVEFAKGRVPVVAGAGANATMDAIALSKACADVGADALLHVTPYYNKPTQEGLYAHFTALAKATDLPIVLYNVPGRTACDLAPQTVAKLAKNPNIVAIKDATGDMHRASIILSLCGDSITLLSGDDFTAFPLLSLGGRGSISVVSNLVPKRVVAMCKAALSGDWQAAREHHFSYQDLAELLFIESNPIPVKAAMELLGHMGPEIRLPLTPASENTRTLLSAQLAAEGLL